MPAEVLFALFLMLTVVTLVGHGIWLLLAALFRKLTGKPAANSGTRPADSPEAIADLWGFSRAVQRLGQWGWIDADEQQRLHALGRRYQERVLGESRPAPRPQTVSTPKPAVLLASCPPSTILPSTSLPSTSLRHPLDPDPVPPPRSSAVAMAAAAAPPSAARPAAFVPTARSRAVSEVLRSFLAAHNIRWGELVAGLLIVVCSIGLVISLWNTLTATHRLLPAMVFLAGTAAIEAAGLYTLRRWRLRHTSRAVLLIATLLIPLSVVAGVGMAGTGADAVHLTDPLTIGFFILGSVVYGGAIWLSGLAMVRRHDAPWWTLAVAVPTALLPIVPASVRALGAQAGWMTLAGSAAAAVALAMIARRGAWQWPPRRCGAAAIRNRWLIALVSGYSLAVLLAFLVLRSGGSLAATVPMAIGLMPAMVALAALGLSMRRDSRAATLGVVGGVIFAVSGLVIASVFPVTLVHPTWLTSWALAVAGTALLMAVGLNLRWLVTLAALAGGLALVLTSPSWLSGLPWPAALLLWRRLFASDAMVTACALGMGLVVTGGLSRWDGRRVRPFQSPLAVSGACWSVVASLQALVLGCLTWLPGVPAADTAALAGLTQWQWAVVVLLVAGATSIAAARRAAGPRWLAPSLLAAGQSALLVALALIIAWSRPALLLDASSWAAASRTVWGWIGLSAAYGLIWQMVVLVLAARAPLGRLLRRSPLRIDLLACGAAGVAVIACGAAALLHRLVDYHQSLPTSTALPTLVPLVAMALTVAGLLLAAVANRDHRNRSLVGTAWVTDAAILASQAILLWWLVRFSSASVEGLALVGSGALAAGVVAALLAWWGLWQARRGGKAEIQNSRVPLLQTSLGRLAGLSSAWSALVLLAVSGVLLQGRVAEVLRSGAAIDPASAAADSLRVAATWMTLAAVFLAVASVVSLRRSLGWLAAALLPVAAVLAAASAGTGPWQWLAAAGWAAVLAVAVQRLWERLGGQHRLRALAVGRSTVDSSAPKSGDAAHATSPSAASLAPWPLPVVALAQWASVIAVLVAAVATAAVWSEPSWARQAVDGGALGLIAAVAAMAITRGDRWQGRARLGVLPVLVASTGAIVALAIRWQAIGIDQSWRALVVIWLATAVIAALHCAVGQVTGRRWPLLSGGWGRWGAASRAEGAAARWDAALAVAIGGVVAALGYVPRVFVDPTAWASIAACAVLGALALAAARRNRAEGAGRAVWRAAEVLAGVVAVAAVPVLGERIDQLLGDRWIATSVVVWLFGWAVAWRVMLPAREADKHPAVDSLLVWLGIVPLLWLLGLSTLEYPQNIAAGLVGALAAVAVVVSTPLRIERKGQTAAAYVTLMCVVLGIAGTVLRLAGIDGDLRVSAAMVCMAAAATLLGWGWPLRRTLRQTMQRASLRWSDPADRQSEAEFAFCVLATVAGITLAAVVSMVGDWGVMSRYLAVGAVGLSGWAVSGVASRQPGDGLRMVTVLVFCIALALAAVAGPAAADHRHLITVMRLLVVGVLLVPSNLWLAARVLRLPLQQWQWPLCAGAVAGAGLAAVSLGLMLVGEVMIRDSQGIAGLSAASVIGVATVLTALSVLCVIPAVAPQVARVGRVLPDLSDPQRKALIYAAQLMAALAWLHVYLCRPEWGMIGLRPYWPLLVMGLAFLSAAVTEWARRRGDRVLSDVLRQTALYLPLIPVIGFWLSGARIDWSFAGGRLPYAAVLAAGALFYGGLSMLWRRQYVPRVIGVVLGNAALWVGLAQTPGWEFTRHPQLWLIPPAVCVLVAVHWERRRLDPAVAMAIRYAAALLIYISSTADMLLQQVGTTIGGPIMLISLALAGLAAGVVLRVRAFLYLGTTFVLIGVLSMVWHAQQAIDQVWPWWVFGITSGVLLLAGLMALEKNKGKLKQISDRLGGWEG